MKKLYLTGLAIFALFAVSCNKETPASEETLSNESVITGVINAETVKTAYNSEGKFSWVANDAINVQVVGTGTNSGNYDIWAYSTTDNDVATATFTRASDPTDWTIGNYAFYPRAFASLSYNKDNPVTVTLPASTEDWTLTNLLSMVPLIGEKTYESGQDARFEFVSAAGILKLNFSGVPNQNGLRLVLSHPSYPLCGKFSLSSDNTILEGNYIESKSDRTLCPAAAFTTAYVALPIGEIPAGLSILLKKTSGEVYASITTNTSIVIKRNTITDLTQTIKAVTSQVSVSGTSNAPTANITVASGEEVAYAVAGSESTALSSLSTADWSSSTQNISLQSASEPFGSKKLYLAYKVKASDGHVYVKRAIPYYYLTAADKAKYVTASPLTMTGSPVGGNQKVSFSESNDVTKGQLILDNFDGMTRRAALTELAQGHPLFTTMSPWLGGTDSHNSTYHYSSSRVSDGSQFYGVIDGNTLTFNYGIGKALSHDNGTPDYSFFHYSVDGSGDARVFLFTSSNSANSIDSYVQPMVFNIGASALTATNVKVRFYGNYCSSTSAVASSASQAAKLYAASVSIAL